MGDISYGHSMHDPASSGASRCHASHTLQWGLKDRGSRPTPTLTSWLRQLTSLLGASLFLSAKWTCSVFFHRLVRNKGTGANQSCTTKQMEVIFCDNQEPVISSYYPIAY